MARVFDFKIKGDVNDKFVSDAFNAQLVFSQVMMPHNHTKLQDGANQW